MAVSRYVRMGLEPSFGTVATSFIGVRVQSVEPSIDRQAILDETIEDYTATDAVGGPLKVSLSMELAARPNHIHYILAALMGSYTVTDLGGPGPYQWDYSLSTPMSLTVEVGEENKTIQYLGVGINSCEFTFEAREIVKLSVDCIAKTYQDGIFTTPTYDTDKPFVFYEAQLKVDNAKVAGSKSVSLTVDRGLADDEYVLDDFTLYALKPERTEISGRMTLTDDEIDELNRAIYGSTIGTSVPTTNDIGTVQLDITCTRGSYELTLSAPVAIYNTGSYSLSSRDRIEREIEFKVVGDFTIKLVNDKLS